MADESKCPSLTEDGVPDRLNFPSMEEDVLKLWKALDAFKTQLRLTEGKKEYNFYDGPPFATGLPHYGHILAGTIKDVVTRFKSMEGYYVSRRFGWDCHGLPVEYEIDKKLGIKSTDDVEKMGIRAYNAECRSIVSRYCEQWEAIVTRLGRWIDFRNDYKTMEPWYMESVWWVFKTVFDKDLVYRGFKIMPYSTACNTPLSNFEAGQNYKEVRDPAVMASFPVVGQEGQDNTHFVAWTTTPWTLPSNLALCVNGSMTYSKVFDKARGKNFILMKACLSILYPKLLKKKAWAKSPDFEEVAEFTGAELVGWRYEPLFPYFADHPGAFRVLSDDYVTDSAGTGVVHQAPAFGEDDYRVCLAHGVVTKGGALPCPVDANGRFTEQVSDYVGQHVKAADDAICARLKTEGRLVNKGSVAHNYPFCWRSDTPLIYRAVPSWFVNVTAIKSDLLRNNEQTYWVPSFVKEKRFHNWLRDARDWAVSRTRYWGTPIPLWVSDDGEEVVCVGSIDELEELSGVRPTDLHRENIDHITIPSRMGKGDLKRVPEVFDCWFESGSMPYAQVHYPFENKEKFDAHFPADFIAEGLDQTRGWFYTLMVLSTALKNKPAFKNLIVNGLVLAKDGKKMSKRLKNYPPPSIVLNAYGADALRLYLINSPVVRAEPLCFRKEGVHGVIKDVFLPWFNAFRFFMVNAERLKVETGATFVPDASSVYSSSNEMDQWLMAALQGLIKSVREEMDAYRLYNVAPPLVSFVQQLTNWYVRLNRTRLKGADGADSARVALNGMYEVLLTMACLMAPLTPFFTEYMYQHLRTFHPDFANADAAENAMGRAASVHFLSIPPYDESKIAPQHVAKVETMQTVVELGRQIRERAHISIKMPVREVIVVHTDTDVLGHVTALQQYISAELNAITVSVTSDESAWCQVSAATNPKTLGRRVGRDYGAVAASVAGWTHEEVVAFAAAGDAATAEVNGHTLTAEDVKVSRAFKGDTSKFAAGVSRDGLLTVVINTVEDAELRAMNLARETVNRVQKLRKATGLQFSDVVDVYVRVSERDPTAGADVPAPVLEAAGVAVDVPEHALRPKPKAGAGAGVGAGAGAGSGAGAGGSKQKKNGGGGNKWAKGKKKNGGGGGGKKKNGGGGGKKWEGKKKGGNKKAAAAKKRPAGAAGKKKVKKGSSQSPAEAVATVTAALNTQAGYLAASLPTAVLPDAMRPDYAVVLGQETTDVGGADMTVTLCRPHVRFAADETFGTKEAPLFKALLADMDVDMLKEQAAAGPVSLTVGETTLPLQANTHFFFSSANQYASDAATRATWESLGMGNLGATIGGLTDNNA